MPRAPLQVLYHRPFAKPIPYEKLSVSASILQESYQATLRASEALWELLTWHLCPCVLSWVCQGSWVYLFSKYLWEASECLWEKRLDNTTSIWHTIIWWVSGGEETRSWTVLGAPQCSNKRLDIIDYLWYYYYWTDWETTQRMPMF